MINEQTPIAFQNPLPKAVDVVIVGGGVIGVSTAWFLRKAGLRVLICEKGRVAGEQSSRNWGWVRQQGRDPSAEELCADCPELVGELKSRIRAVRRMESVLSGATAPECLSHSQGQTVAPQRDAEPRRLAPPVRRVLAQG